MTRDGIITTINETKAFCPNESKQAIAWLKTFSKSAAKEEIIYELKGPKWAYYWAKRFGDRDEMKVIAAASGSSSWVHHWTRYFGGRQEMKSIFHRYWDYYKHLIGLLKKK